jgi:Ca2+-binding EF-hand superfamily protein
MAAMNQEKIISLKKVEQAFKIFDTDGDGFISKAEIEQVMGEVDDDVLNLTINAAVEIVLIGSGQQQRWPYLAGGVQTYLAQ